MGLVAVVESLGFVSMFFLVAAVVVRVWWAILWSRSPPDHIRPRSVSRYSLLSEEGVEVEARAGAGHVKVGASDMVNVSRAGMTRVAFCSAITRRGERRGAVLASMKTDEHPGK